MEFQLNINLWTHYSDVFHHNLLFEIFCQKQFNLNDSWNLIVFLQSFRSATLLGSTTWWRRWLWRTIFQKEAKIILCPPGRATGTIPTPWGSCHASRWTSASWNTHLCNLCWPEDAGSWAAKNDGKKIFTFLQYSKSELKGCTSFVNVIYNRKWIYLIIFTVAVLYYNFVASIWSSLRTTPHFVHKFFF